MKSGSSFILTVLKRGHISHSRLGFTIVELLVVIVVIGILAAITIVSYMGITNRAAAVSSQSDLANAAKKLKLYQVENSAYPTGIDCTASPAANTICLKSSSVDTVYRYTAINGVSPQAFSLYAVNGNNIQYISDDTEPSEYTPVIASGGSATDINGFRIHAFSSSGTLTVTSGGQLEVLVVAGAGAGGSNDVSSTGTASGGGGAGGLIYQQEYLVISGQSITVTVGNGGIITDTNGQNSVFGTLTAIGGGRGACKTCAAVSGGSGGGGSYYFPPLGVGTIGQGKNGGGNTVVYYGGSGGGGAGTVGSSSFGGNGANGGAGLYFGSIFGDTFGQNGYFSGGGGGGSPVANTPGSGGSGGGGTGGDGIGGISAIANTGGGGGGSGIYLSVGGNGGSGIVLVRYLN